MHSPAMRVPDFSEQLAELKQRVMYGRDFGAAVTYFHDHLGDNDLFNSKKFCHRAKAEKLDALLRAAVETFFKKQRLLISDGIILRARGTPFYHGGLQVENHLCTFIYFDDIAMGILSIVRPDDPTTHFLRLTAFPVSEGSPWN